MQHLVMFSVKFLTVCFSGFELLNSVGREQLKPNMDVLVRDEHECFSDELSSERKPVAVLLLPAVTETAES